MYKIEGENLKCEIVEKKVDTSVSEPTEDNSPVGVVQLVDFEGEKIEKLEGEKNQNLSAKSQVNQPSKWVICGCDAIRVCGAMQSVCGCDAIRLRDAICGPDDIRVPVVNDLSVRRSVLVAPDVSIARDDVSNLCVLGHGVLGQCAMQSVHKREVMQSVHGLYAQSFLGQREIMQCVDDGCEEIQPVMQSAVQSVMQSIVQSAVQSVTKSVVQSVMQSAFLCTAAQSVQRCQVQTQSVQRLVVSDQARVGRCVMNSVPLSGVRSRDTNKWECWKYNFRTKCCHPDILTVFGSGSRDCERFPQYRVKPDFPESE